MPTFSPGEEKTARVTVHNPTAKALDYVGRLYLDTQKKAEASFHLEAGEQKDVLFPVTMPAEEGTYSVTLNVLVGGEIIATYMATEDVKIEVFNPWIYDIDNDGYIDFSDCQSAAADLQAGKITSEQYTQVYYLYRDFTRNPSLPPPDTTESMLIGHIIDGDTGNPIYAPTTGQIGLVISFWEVGGSTIFTGWITTTPEGYFRIERLPHSTPLRIFMNASYIGYSGLDLRNVFLHPGEHRMEISLHKVSA